jgi:hypothetical protein
LRTLTEAHAGGASRARILGDWRPFR